MTDHTPKPRWWTLNFCPDALHVSSVCTASAAMGVGDIVSHSVLGIGDTVPAGAFAMIILGLTVAVILDEMKAEGSIALMWVRQLAVAKSVIVLVAGYFFDFLLGGILVDLAVLLLAGTHVMIVMMRGIHRSFARQQAEIDAKEGVGDEDDADGEGDDDD